MQLTDKEKQEWYSNKDLYEMMVDLSKGLEQTNAELAKTRYLSEITMGSGNEWISVSNG